MITKNYTEDIIREVVRWLENSLNTPLLIESIAGKSGYSRWYFQRIFKKSTGVALGTYVRERRLARAALDLKLTRKTVLEIALKYGFESQQTFTRSF
ncbi:helix-turn-helix domain-containing protein, partial [Salmonella enterica]|nr:helix-turn-helix domain-containing protein [Salmonella enterica subsp. enterica serovar Newport]EGM3723026.1 helix-turn-helix domain-containing protein [Salmonella enterica subsp. enterica serovar Newport]EKT1275009.1 helix-turn-helix domain-containing protein [Salmonella enterica]